MAANKRVGKKSLAQNDFLQPLSPVSVSAVDSGLGRAYNNGSAIVSFSLPAGSPAATSYTVTSSPGSLTATGASSPLTVTGLQSAVSYTFTVVATNAQGNSSASSASSAIIATTVPQAPQSITAAADPSTNYDNVSWTQPANGGSAITAYNWASSDAKSGSTTLLSVSVAQEPQTQQSYTVYATNVNGNSSVSVSSSLVTSYYNYNNFYNFYNYYNYSNFYNYYNYSNYANVFSFSCVDENTSLLIIDENDQIALRLAKDLKIGNTVISPVWDEYNFDNNPDLQRVEYDSLTNKTVKAAIIESITVNTVESRVIINEDLEKQYSPTHPILARKINKKDAWEQVVSLEVGDIFWEYQIESQSYLESVVESIRLISEPSDVYMIGVEGTDTFIAGGIVSHR